MKVKKLTMLRHTIELCAATQIWRGLPVEKRQDILSKFVPDREKAAQMSNSIDIPTHGHQFHANWLSGGSGGSRTEQEMLDDQCFTCGRTRRTTKDEALRVGLGKNLGEFIDAVLTFKSRPVVVTEEAVTTAHNEMRHAPWDVTIRQVRMLSISRAQFLNVKHIPGGQIEVFTDVGA